jgi:hypothetical protein
MGCCGQRRAAAVTPAPRASERVNHFSLPIPVAKPTAPANKKSTLRYIGLAPLSLRGPRSGRAYYFPKADDAANVDEQDIDAMLRTQLFVRAES